MKKHGVYPSSITGHYHIHIDGEYIGLIDGFELACKLFEFNVVQRKAA